MSGGDREAKALVAQQVFGGRAAFYAESACHRDKTVLDRVVDLARPERGFDVLDVATGAGHTAFALAPHVRQVVAVDITREMLGEARRLGRQGGFRNVRLAVADVHALPFSKNHFDVVTCRRAAHHFAEVDLALAEMARVLRPGGRLIVDDRTVPEDPFVDDCMNELDVLHDRSHVREYPVSVWMDMLAARGLEVEAVVPYQVLRPLSALTDGVTPSDASAILAIVSALPPDARRRMGVVERDGETWHLHWFVTLSARKRQV